MAYDTGAAEPLPAAAPASAGADPDDDSEAQAAADQAARYAAWRARSQRTKTKKQNGFIPDWSTNRDYRRGKSSADAADSTRIRSVVDWAFTKAKAAQLFSQVPEVRGEAKLPELAPAVPVFVRELNEALGKAKVGVAMDEALPDVINAAGIGVVLMAYEAITEMRKALKVDISLMTPEQAEMVKQMPGAYEDVPFVLDQRFTATHISPDDFLWPLEFKGSDFDKSPWLGYTGRATWTQARQMFPKLTDEDKDAVLGQRDRSKEQAGSDDERDGEEMVEFDDIYYRAFCYDADCKSYSVIKRITFVRGKDEPVVDENWKGQRPLPDGRYVGACDYPVRVLTLTYMSDEAIPPSDSAMGRPMVDELIKSRSQAYEQREFSKPMRWFDVNRVDPTIMDQLMAGTYQGMIPTQGPGDRVIGEVARASFPRETFELENLLKEELQQSWKISPNQIAAFNATEKSASEAQIVQANFATQIGYERGRVAAFFVGMAKVLAGLLALYGQFTVPEISVQDDQRLQTWDRTTIPNEMVFSIRADSTVLLDSQQRLAKANQFVNMYGKSGFVVMEEMLREIAALSGFDPDKVVKAPEPKAPETPSIGFSFKGEDITQPIPLAILMQQGLAPTPEAVANALKLLQMAVTAVPGVPVPGAAAAPGPGEPPAPEAGSGDVPLDSAGPPAEDRLPHLQMLDRVNSRRNDGSAA